MALIDNFGWQAALTVFAVLMLLIVPLSLALVTPKAGALPASGAASPVQDQSFKQALSEAFFEALTTASTFGHSPVDVLERALDITGLTVNTIRVVDV